MAHLNLTIPLICLTMNFSNAFSAIDLFTAKGRDGKTLVYAADAMYTMENMVDAIPPGLYWDMPQAMEALYIFKIMKLMGAEVAPAHDPIYWKKQTLAPKTFGS